MSQIYIVATPIGNLEDMTFRAVETLKNVDLIAAEDTRQTKKLCNRYEIGTRMTSYHAQSGEGKLNQILRGVAGGNTLAYVTDAGTPGISDPGSRLVSGAVAMGIEVIPIPGPCALTALLSVAGRGTDRFVFHGFLPHKKGRQTMIKGLNEEVSHALYESVHRMPKLLKELKEHWGMERGMVIGRELTKMYEEVFRGTVGEALEHFGDENTRGEFVVFLPRGV